MRMRKSEREYGRENEIRTSRKKYTNLITIWPNHNTSSIREVAFYRPFYCFGRESKATLLGQDNVNFY